MGPDLEIAAGQAEVNGTNLYYEIAGSGTPVLFIHGNFGDRRHWDEQFLVFARKHRVIRYDVRGFGVSALPIEGQAYSHHRDAAELLRFLGIPSAHIIGLSMGAGIAADFVLAHPEMSRSLVSVGPWVVGFDSPAVNELFDRFKTVASVFKSDGKDVALKQFTDLILGDSLRDQPVRKRLHEIGKDYSFWHLSHSDPGETQVSSVTDKKGNLAAQLTANIRVPTLIVTSERDLQPCGEIATLLEQTVTGARKAVVPDAGHVINMENPYEFNSVVLSFLADVDRASCA
jgi:3-oxoadipate enol-lactonase